MLRIVDSDTHINEPADLWQSRLPAALRDRAPKVAAPVVEFSPLLGDEILAEIIAMIDRCPSGTLAYTLEPEGEVMEPDLPKEVVVVPDGPLWITGGIPVERADGEPLETRNRVTLCRCGASKTKPLCDGSHKDIGFSDT